MFKLAVLISGEGTNLQALLDAQTRGVFSNAVLSLVVSDRLKAGGLARARRAGVETVVVPRKKMECLPDILTGFGIDRVVLSGFLSILPSSVVSLYRRRIINIHPALTPLFSGMGYYGIKVHEAVIASGMKVTGATVHFVDEGVDTGTIIAQHALPVCPDDTPEVLQRRVLGLEHTLLVDVVRAWTEGRVRETDNQVWVAGL